MYLRRLTVVNLSRRTSLRTSLQSSLSLLIVVTTSWLLCGKLAVAQSDSDLFESEIRPLLIKHCYECHGPKKQESDLRLDSQSSRLAGGISGPSIVPGNPESSLLVKAIRKTDADLAMPPGEKKLAPHEIAAIEKWIIMGAKSTDEVASTDIDRLTLEQAPEFWSFQPVLQEEPPSSEAVTTWSQTPIDQFVRARMLDEGLKSVGMADKRTLIRRATFDLTGLPPTPQAIAKFLADDSQDAFANVVDRLLDSHSYGERWGRHWLDVARYADTAGDGADYPVREAYKYRDWVIDAFNADKPYDEFVREQIAGDIIANQAPLSEYSSLVTATGFLAIGKRYGYKPSPDYQHLDYADVIDSVGRSLLGLTIGCARCHDHKYDPISAEDYYALYGIMQSTVWAFPGGEEQKRPSQFPALIPEEKVKLLQQDRDHQLAELESQVLALKNEARGLDPELRAGGADLGMEAQQLGKPLVDPWVCAGNIEVREDAQSPFHNVHAKGARGVRVGTGLKTDGIRYVFEPGLKTASAKMISFNVDFRPRETNLGGAFRLYLGQGVIQSIAIEVSVTPETISIRNGNDWDVLRKVDPGTWYSLQLKIDSASGTYSGYVGTKNDVTEISKKNVATGWNGIADCFISDGFAPGDYVVMERDIDNVALTAYSLKPLDFRVVETELNDEDKQRLEEIALEVSAVEAEQKALAGKPVYEVAYGVSEGTPTNAMLQLRGEPEKLGSEVPRRFLEVLGGQTLPPDYQGSGRKELAEWITDATNPLTARVMVNRIWRWHFGKGLVTTPSDFGFRGAKPSHPKLLDWLAAEFIKSNWSIKAIHRLIMNSKVYQLASSDSDIGLAQDPDNTFLWRYARRPLDAESMRDAMLFVSGNLDQSTSGPHPFPDVNTWSYTIHHPFHAVYDSSHRSIYLMQQRNRRHPYLELFDSADPNVSIGKRQQTVTPTQALYLLNSKFVHEQSHGVAKRILAGASDQEARIRLAIEMLHGIEPTAEDLDSARTFIQSYKTAIEGQANAETQAWSAFARVLMTSNNFLFVE